MNIEEHFKYYIENKFFGFFDNDCMKNDMPMDRMTEYYKSEYDDLEI